MLNITFVLTQATAGAVQGDSHASTCSPVCNATSSRLTHILVCGFLPTGKLLCSVKAITSKGPVMEHRCHTQTERVSSDQVASNVKSSHYLVTQ